MYQTVSVNGTQLAKGSIPLSGTSTPLSEDLTFTLDSPATVDYVVTNEGAGTEKPVISWLAVADVTMPGAPGNVTALAAGDTSITVSWAPSSPTGLGFTGYQVYDGYGTTPVCTTTKSSCTITSLDSGSTHTFTVTGVNQVGEGSPSAASNPITLPKATQTINLATLNDHTVGDRDFAINASASSGLPITFTASGSCSLAGNLVHITGAGECMVTATQPGDDKYAAAASVTQSFTIAKGNQSIAFGSLSNHTLGDADFTLNATASSALPVTFAGTGACTLTGNTVHLTQAGDCAITAAQPGDQNYNAADPVTQTFTVARGAAVVSAPVVSTPWGTAATVTVQVTSSVAAVSGQVHLNEGATDRGTVTLTNGQATITLPVGLSAGTHTITAAYLGNSNLAPASATTTVTVVLPPGWKKSTAYQKGSTVSYNGQVYTASWYTQGEVPGSNNFGAWQQIAMAEDGTALWTPSRIFNAGDKVSYQGKVFEAAWYTRDDTPGSVTAPWEEIATAPDGTALWTPTRIFNAGDTAEYNNVKYTAKWYTRDQVPGTPNGPWTAKK